MRRWRDQVAVEEIVECRYPAAVANLGKGVEGGGRGGEGKAAAAGIVAW